MKFLGSQFRGIKSKLGKSKMNRAIARLDKAKKRTNRLNADGENSAIELMTATEDANMSKLKEYGTDIFLCAYGVDEFITASYLKTAVDSGKNTITVDDTWQVPPNFVFRDWVQSKSQRFNFMSTRRAILFLEQSIAEVSNTHGKLAIEITGPEEFVQKFILELDSEFTRAKNLIQWVYAPDGSSIEVPLNHRVSVAGAYPWIDKDLKDYFNDYINSEASVLILLGPPGTGKSTFIKNLIHYSKSGAKVTYDERVLNSDSFFADFIEGSSNFLVMEDADTFLSARTDGNTMMHRFLNVSDGLISAKDKKLIFSTNLPSIRDIDSALLRPGRCFDIIEFRALTRAEAEVVSKNAGTVLPDGQEFTLSEIFCSQPSTSHGTNRKVGFV